MDYIYNDNGYVYSSLHRRVVEFDPRNTDNVIIQDIIHTTDCRDVAVRKKIQSQMIAYDMSIYNSNMPSVVPIAFQLLYNQVNYAWVSIIHQMIFIDEMYMSFYGEYRDTLHKVLGATINSKDSLVYRYYGSGESIFHVAGKLWLLKVLELNINDAMPMKIARLEYELEYIVECYSKLGELFDLGNSECISDIKDYSGQSLYDYLNRILEDLCNMFLT